MIIHFYSQSESRVEVNYSNLVYPFIAGLLRSVFGFFSFSFGDILYLILFVWLVCFLVNFIKGLIYFKSRKIEIKHNFYKLLIMLLTVYTAFNLLWGINYNRKGIATQLQLKSGKYDSSQLKLINQLLLERVNASKDSILKNQLAFSVNHHSLEMAINAYGTASHKYSFLLYDHPVIKPSLWGWLGNYVGFTGYYNPFTGEAQVNTTVPAFLQPYIACHEIAHQLGYAKENEANFVGYLAAKNSNNYLLKYSAYLDLFMYANRSFYVFDSASAMHIRKQLSDSVKSDIEEWRNFNKTHENKIEPMITKLYGLFLQNNRQPMGMMTYDEVTGLLIHYYEKTGEL